MISKPITENTEYKGNRNTFPETKRPEGEPKGKDIDTLLLGILKNYKLNEDADFWREKYISLLDILTPKQLEKALGK